MRKRRETTKTKQFTVIEGQARPGSNWKQRAVFYVLLALAAVFIIQAGYHWLGSLFLSWRLQIIVVEPASLETSVETGGVITRQEKVIKAPVSGVLRDLHQAGVRVAVGTKLAEIVLVSREDLLSLDAEDSPKNNVLESIRDWLLGNQDHHGEDQPLIVTGEIPSWFNTTESVHAAVPGLLCYHFDGWEPFEGFRYLTAAQFEDTGYTVQRRVEGMFVEAGEQLLKIVNNWRWYFSIILPPDPGQDIAAYDSVKIEFAFASGRRIRGVQEEYLYDAAAGEVRITYRLEEQLPGFERERWSDATVIYHSEQGILIPDSALIEDSGETAVFLNSGGLVTYRPVEVIARRGDKLLVEGVEPFSMVIGRPWLVREGQRLN